MCSCFFGTEVVSLVGLTEQSWQKINAAKEQHWFMQGLGWQTRSAAGLQVGVRGKGRERKKGEVFFLVKINNWVSLTVMCDHAFHWGKEISVSESNQGMQSFPPS